jgi:hypothetical protein
LLLQTSNKEKIRSLKKQKQILFLISSFSVLIVFVGVQAARSLYPSELFDLSEGSKFRPFPYSEGSVDRLSWVSEGTVQNLAHGGSEKYTAKDLAVLYVALMSWNVI